MRAVAFPIPMCTVSTNEVKVYRVMMYANPLQIAWAMNYTENALHICL